PSSTHCSPVRDYATNDIHPRSLHDALPISLQNDELDVSPLNNVDEVLLVRDTPGLEVRRAPGNRWRHITFNGAPGSILADQGVRSEEHTSELQSRENLVCRPLLEKKKKPPL